MTQSSGEAAAASPARERPLRLFVAIPLWEGFRGRNLAHYENLRALPHDLKWVRPDQWHLTLKFLGPVPESAIPALTSSIRTRLEGIAPFEFEIEGLGGFPRLSKCRVLWAGASQGREELNRVAARTAEACREAGFPGDRKNFQAHLTLARSRAGSIAMNVPKELFKASWGTERAESAALVKSVLGAGGSKYEVLERIPFGSGGAG